MTDASARVMSAYGQGRTDQERARSFRKWHCRLLNRGTRWTSIPAN